MVNKHYVFVNGEVLGLRYWSESRSYPKGTYGYSPADYYSDKWFRLTGYAGRWDHLEPEDVPAAFKGQLLLLGIPL